MTFFLHSFSPILKKNVRRVTSRIFFFKTRKRYIKGCFAPVSGIDVYLVSYKALRFAGGDRAAIRRFKEAT